MKIEAPGSPVGSCGPIGLATLRAEAPKVGIAGHRGVGGFARAGYAKVAQVHCSYAVAAPGTAGRQGLLRAQAFSEVTCPRYAWPRYSRPRSEENRSSLLGPGFRATFMATPRRGTPRPVHSYGTFTPRTCRITRPRWRTEWFILPLTTATSSAELSDRSPALE